MTEAGRNQAVEPAGEQPKQQGRWVPVMDRLEAGNQRRLVRSHLVFVCALFALNGLAVFLLYTALGVLFSHQPPAVGIVLALLALPIVLCQPWFIPFLFVPYWCYIAPLPVTAITFFVYRAVVGAEFPVVIMRYLVRRKFWFLGVLTSILLLGAFLYLDIPPLHCGVPGPLKQSVKDLSSVSGSRYYEFEAPFFEEECIWKARISEADLDRLVAAKRMQPMDKEQIPDLFLEKPPIWWRPRISDRIRAFSTPNFPLLHNGGKADNLMAVWNPEDQVLYMWFRNGD